jgi:2-amino-4-hydroxy-6-hydroxymethyldihydropteridine diphosphokinase
VTWVCLGLGSNVEAQDNLHSCLDALLLQFRDMKLSNVFESPAQAQGRGTYLNMAVGFDTDLSLAELRPLLKQMERKQGRSPERDARGEIPLDIDILLYGQQQGNVDGLSLPRPQLLSEAYVLWPLSQVAAQLRHPVAAQTYAALWKNFSGARDGIRPVDFSWHGRRISSAR